jgi:hypothetical protein
MEIQIHESEGKVQKGLQVRIGLTKKQCWKGLGPARKPSITVNIDNESQNIVMFMTIVTGRFLITSVVFVGLSWPEKRMDWIQNSKKKMAILTK